MIWYDPPINPPLTVRQPLSEALDCDPVLLLLVSCLTCSLERSMAYRTSSSPSSKLAPTHAHFTRFYSLPAIPIFIKKTPQKHEVRQAAGIPFYLGGLTRGRNMHLRSEHHCQRQAMPGHHSLRQFACHLDISLLSQCPQMA